MRLKALGRGLFLALLLGMVASVWGEGERTCGFSLARLVARSESASHELFRFHHQTLLEVDAMIQPALQRPDKIEMHVWAPGEGEGVQAAALTDFGILMTHSEHIGSRAADRGTWNPSAAHEYGHFVFAHNMKRRLAALPEFRDAAARGETLSKRLEFLYAQADALRGAAESDSSVAAKLGRIQTEIDALSRELDSGDTLQNFLKKADFKGYEEFFADLVAVLHAHDPAAMRSHLAANFPDLRGNIIRARDFTAEIPATGWSENEIHVLMGPARSFMGAYLKGNRASGHESQILDASLEAIRDELLEFRRRPGLRSKLDPDELNRRFIRRLEARLGPALAPRSAGKR